MKKHPFLIAAALAAGFAFVPLHAQEGTPSAAPAASQSLEIMPLEKGTLLPLAPEGLIVAPPPSASATPSVAPSEPAATPSAAPAEPTATSPAALKKGTAEELRQAVRIRELKTLVLEYPSVQAQKQGAECAQTNTGRCVWMRNYYTLLYTTMEKLDPSLHDVLEEQLQDILERYEQHKVCPSPLIEAVAELPGSHSADHVLPGAKPAATPKHPSKKKPNKLGLSM